jgi:ABC-type nitrate/sulfonate/bicarbonate transport system substrate-binding protein
MRWFHYADHGIELYSNGILVSPQLIKDKPQVVAGLVRAVHKGLRDAIANPDAAIEALAKREPLINKDLEKRRLVLGDAREEVELLFGERVQDERVACVRDDADRAEVRRLDRGAHVADLAADAAELLAGVAVDPHAGHDAARAPGL